MNRCRYTSRVLLLALGVLLALAPRPSAAAGTQGLVLNISETLTRIGPSGITNHSDVELSLCRLALQGRLLGLPVWRRNIGYALAEGDCRDGRYLGLPPQELGAAQRTGMLPPDLPATPPLTLRDGLAGYWGWAVIVLIAIYLWRMPGQLRLRARARDRLRRLRD